MAMEFYVGRDGDVHVLERLPETWSERVAQQARRKATVR
jgi:hypothetical protein